jgi:hypothetical protein
MISHPKTLAFRYQISENTCLENRFCTGRRRLDLKFCRNSFVGPPVSTTGKNEEVFFNPLEERKSSKAPKNRFSKSGKRTHFQVFGQLVIRKFS